MFRPGSIGRDLPGFHTRLDRAAPGVSEVVNTFCSPTVTVLCCAQGLPRGRRALHARQERVHGIPGRRGEDSRGVRQ